MKVNNTIFELLQKLVEINTVNDPIKRIKPSIECVKFIKDFLIEHDIPVEILENNGYYTIYGILGKGKPIIMFMAHYDTVPVNYEEWIYDPFKLTIINGRGYGRGVADDKSNVVAIMYALTELKDRIKDFTLIYAFTGDEEIGGEYGIKTLKEYLLNQNLKPNYVINGDGTGLSIVIRRRNVFRIRIKIKKSKVKVKGRKIVKKFKLETHIHNTRHSAYFIPGIDKHPLIEASYYQRIHNLYVSKLNGKFIKTNVLPSEVEIEYVQEVSNGNEIEIDENLTKLIQIILPITRISFKTKYFSDYGITITPNMYYEDNDYHVFEIDLRAMTMNVNRIRRKIEEILNEYDVKDVEIEVRSGHGYLYTNKNSILVRIAKQVLEEINVKPKIIELPGASDSRYFSPIGIECIDIGPIGGNIHGPNEWVELWSVIKLVKFYKKIPIALKNLSNVY